MHLMLEFWKKNLTKLWAVEKDKKWDAYFAPSIPLQICSNAKKGFGLFTLEKKSVEQLTQGFKIMWFPADSGKQAVCTSRDDRARGSGLTQEEGASRQRFSVQT